ncbi:kinase-like domain-containing protein [Apiospora hydei]|uniref:Kinase-like domain-containing protein n=1 Tax=Apiospora hydei TaxID=1337664 RepID=A0ABR1UT93_9PEZI
MVEAFKEVDGRHLLFVIDDSSTMRGHKDHLYQTCRAMIAVASEVKRVQMVFTSNPTTFIRDRHPFFGGGPKHMVGKIRKHFEQSSMVGTTNMESRMGKILDKVAGKNMKSTSIYIMTDGVWQPSEAPGGGVEVAIKTLVQRLKAESKYRDFITLQFIQFGEDGLGTGRLQYLDDDLPTLEGMQD